MNSPKRRDWRERLLHPFLNQRGEAGPQGIVQKPVPGSGATPPPPSAEPSWDTAPAAPPVAMDTGGQPPPQVEEGQTPLPGLEAPPVSEGATPSASATPPAPAAPKPEDFQKMESEVVKMRADIETYRKMAEYYQTLANDKLAGMDQPQPGVAPTPTPPPSGQQKTLDLNPPQLDPMKLPAGVKPPNAWETQEDMAKFFDHRSSTITSHIANQLIPNEIERINQEVLMPQFKRIQSVLQAVEQHVVKSAFKDFDEVTKDAIDELFVLDPNRNVIGVKNRALLRYIQESPLPSKALYDYALSRRAPKAIAEAKVKSTKELLSQIDAKPKGPTIPPTSTPGPAQPAELDWDTPEDTVDRTLQKRGLIK